MKAIAFLMMLTALSSPAYARDSYSFVVNGHRIHVEASLHCRSLSCVSVSIPGIGSWHRGHRDADDVATVNNPAPATAPAPVPAQQQPQRSQPQALPVYAPPVAQVTPAQPSPPLTRAQTIAPAAQAQPAAQPTPVQPAPRPVQAQPSPVPAPRLAAAPPAPPAPPSAPRPSAMPPAPAATPQNQAKPQAASTDKPKAKPQAKIADKPAAEPPAPRVDAPVSRVSQRSDSAAAATPVGDWQTEGKSGTVRIEACGKALCGYMLDVSTGTKGETILVNMKSKSGTDKSSSKWTGNVYSRSSGNSYYGTMTLKDPRTLRVEACALGSFFCSGNNWTRLEDSRSVRPESEVANSRQNAPQPRS